MKGTEMLAEGALQGVRVLDFTWVVAGPLAASILADQGAEVIKIENPKALVIPLGDERFGFDGNLNRNKHAITINLSHPRGLDIIKRLVRISDIVLENFSARVMENWGLDYQSQKQINPSIIYMSMGSVGHAGRLRDWVTYGPVLQGMCGLDHLTAFPGGPPLGIGYSYADVAGAYTAALGLLFALWHRQQTGEGQYIDLAQLEAACSLLGPALLESTANDVEPEPVGNGSSDFPAAPHGVYRCKGEDRWCVIAVYTDEEWQALCQVLGEPGWARDPRFSTPMRRVENADELDRLVEAWTVERDAEEVMQLMVEAGIAAGVVQHGDDIIDRDPQLQFRYWERPVSPEGTAGRYVGIPPKLSVTPAMVRRCGPKKGEHNEYVIGKLLGVSDAEMAKLREEGVI